MCVYVCVWVRASARLCVEKRGANSICHIKIKWNFKTFTYWGRTPVHLRKDTSNIITPLFITQILWLPGRRTGRLAICLFHFFSKSIEPSIFKFRMRLCYDEAQRMSGVRSFSVPLLFYTARLSVFQTGCSTFPRKPWTRRLSNFVYSSEIINFRQPNCFFSLTFPQWYVISVRLFLDKYSPVDVHIS